ncbi:MAG: uncharacterized protein A8A55_2728, partial [Amphiamblys sp. WSBS2006]
PGYIAGILKEENNSIWIGRVRTLKLRGHAVKIFPKLKLHGENEMEELVLDAYETEHITEIREAKDKSIWIGKVKKLELKDYAIQLLPKLKLQKENAMEELVLSADSPEHITEILEAKDKSIWLRKVKVLRLKGHTEKIKDKLDFILIAPDGQEEIGGA